jgi:iron complex outermembrane receptor protein
MYRNFIFSFFLMLGVFLCPVMAQTFFGNDGDEYLDLGSAGGIVVTASRTPESAAAVPAQVTVISADDIAASGANSITEVLKHVPGLRFLGGLSGAGSESVSMRGFGENSFGRVLVLVDGNKINNPDMKDANWNAIALSDVERIEVMDGSAAVQYGNNAVGGVINIITKKSGKRRTLIGVSGGSFFSHRESISHFEPLDFGIFSISAEFAGTNGYRERQGSRTANAAAGAELFLKSSLSLTLNAYFSDLFFQLPGGLTKAQFKDDPEKALTYEGLPNFSDENTERHFGGSIGLQWFPAGNVEFDLPLSYKGKFISMDMASYGTYTDRVVHTAEARPQFSINFNPLGLRLLGGGDVYFVKLAADAFSKENHTDKVNSFDISEWILGSYLTSRFSPLPGLAFFAGLRFDMASIEAQKKGAGIDESKRYTAIAYEGGIVFNPFAELKLYAKYSSVFRYPFVDELAQVSGFSDKFNSDLKPETGFNAETGATWQVGKTLEIKANFFVMDLKDEIAVAFLDPSNPFDATNVNLNKTRRLGGNAGLVFSPFACLSVDASYSFINAVFLAGENKGKNVPLVPNHVIFAGFTVRLPGGFDFGPELEYTSSAYCGEDYANEGDKMESRFLLGAKARYALQWEGREIVFLASIKNLLGVSYASYGTYSYGSYYLYPADGRSLSFTLQYRF